MRVIDLHAHILPGVDDGPPTIEEARRAGARGGRGGHARDRRRRRTSATCSACDPRVFSAPAGRGARTRSSRAGVELELLLGRRARAVAARRARRRRRCAGRPRRRPLRARRVSVLAGRRRARARWCTTLQQRGFGASCLPTRSARRRSSATPERLAGSSTRGALAQVTAGSLPAASARSPDGAASAMLQQGLVHVLASDAHDAIDRPPGMAAGLRAAGRRAGHRRAGRVDDRRRCRRRSSPATSFRRGRRCRAARGAARTAQT